APGHHDLGRVLGTSLERDPREERLFAPRLPVNEIGERDLARLPGDEPGVPDPKRDAEPPLGHLLGREVEAESTLGVGPDRGLATPCRRRWGRAPDRTLDGDCGALDGLAALELDHSPREGSIFTGPDAPRRRRRTDAEQAGQHGRRRQGTDSGPTGHGCQPSPASVVDRTPDPRNRHGRCPRPPDHRPGRVPPRLEAANPPPPGPSVDSDPAVRDHKAGTSGLPGFPGWLLIRTEDAYKVVLSVERSHTIGRLSCRATVARRTRARSRSRLVSSGTGEARTKGGDRVCSDNQGRLA